MLQMLLFSLRCSSVVNRLLSNSTWLMPIKELIQQRRVLVIGLVTVVLAGSFILPGIYSIDCPDLIPALIQTKIVLNCREVFLPRSNKSWKTKLCVGMKLPELIPGRIKCHYWNLASIAPINIIKVNPGRADHHHLANINSLPAQEPLRLHLC